MAKRRKRTRSEEKAHYESRKYGFFWYDWIWKFVRPLLVCLASFIIVCGLVYTGWLKVEEMYFAPVDASDPQTISFEVTSGSSLSTVARNLETAGLIHNHTVFKYMADFMGAGQKIQSGNYQLSKAMSATEIMNQLVTGDGIPNTMTITIIPGWTVTDIAAYLKEKGAVTSEEEFLELCRTGSAYTGFECIEAVSGESDFSDRLYALEGYLSPNTYEIYTNAGADGIIRKLLSQTESAYLSSYDERAQELGMTMDDVFTLASMIEKEAKSADFAKVSAVFHNRLKKKMALQSDATVKYVSGSQKMYLNSSDLSVSSPYNTYLVTGLPAGPICNPSMDAVVAALYPDEQYTAQGYLYFCSADPDSGELVFAKTLEEHEANVNKYAPLWQEYDSSRGLN